MSQLMMTGAGRQASKASGPPNPLFSNVQFLYNNAGTDGNDPTGDNAVVGGAMAVIGTRAYDNDVAPPFGGVWIYTSTSGTGQVPYNSAHNILAQDFCYERFLRFETNAPSAERTLASQYITSGSDRCWMLTYDGTDFKIYWSTDGSSFSTATRASSLSADTTYHVALSREGATLRIFVDGVKVGTDIAGTASALRDLSVNASTKLAFIGNGQSLFGGTPAMWHGPIRFTIGEAIYTENFTPPSVLFPES